MRLFFYYPGGWFDWKRDFLRKDWYEWIEKTGFLKKEQEKFFKIVKEKSEQRMLVGEKEVKIGLKAAVALLKSGSANDLLNEGERLFCQISLHKIPQLPLNHEVRKLVKLPHRIHPKSSSVCLIVKDTESDAEKTVDQFRDMLKEVDVKSVDLILPLDTLKKEWKGHELKRKLAQQHETFLADFRIFRLASPHLGKEFLKRRRYPFPIRMGKHQMKLVPEEIKDALRTAQVIITSKGVNVNIFFANTELTEQEQFENLKTLLENVNEFIPRGSKNVKSITLQGTNAKSVPIYRNDEVAEEINQKSGLEIEKLKAHKDKLELLKELQPKSSE